MKKFHLFTLLAALLLAQSVFASWDLGLDLRARFYTNNNLPNDKYGESGSTSFGRFRTRVWGAYKTDDFGFYLRLANEFRDYHGTCGHSRPAGHTPGQWSRISCKSHGKTRTASPCSDAQAGCRQL